MEQLAKMEYSPGKIQRHWLPDPDVKSVMRTEYLCPGFSVMRLSGRGTPRPGPTNVWHGQEMFKAPGPVRKVVGLRSGKKVNACLPVFRIRNSKSTRGSDGNAKIGQAVIRFRVPFVTTSRPLACACVVILSTSF